MATLLKLESEEDYSFQLKTEDWQCLILVREREVYLLWEIRAEEEFSISSLVEEQRVRWTDTGEAKMCIRDRLYGEQRKRKAHKFGVHRSDCGPDSSGV